MAFDPHLDREIAIQIPHKGVFENSAAVDRFYREAKAAAKLKHANIVQVHDAGSDGSTHFIAAELIAGKTLKEACPADGMEIRLAVRIVADLAGAVFYAHRNQIIHRDIKPGNVLIDEAQHPYLTDFGLASRMDASALTTEGAILGTPIYMAPEQAAGRFGAALPACDQYSLGTVLYELLTGRPPFSGTTSVVLYHKLNTEPSHPRTIRPDIPPAVEAMCLRAMERIPEKRYPDCEAMAAALRAWLGESPVAKRVRRLPWVAIGALAVGSLTVLLTVALWPGRKERNATPSEVSRIENAEWHNSLYDRIFDQEDANTAINGFGESGGHFRITQLEPGVQARNITQVPMEFAIELVGRVRGNARGGLGIVFTNTSIVPHPSLGIEISNQGWLLVDRGIFEGDSAAQGPRAGPIQHDAIKRGEEYNTLVLNQA